MNEKTEKKLDAALEDTFPASDPVSFTQPREPETNSRTAYALRLTDQKTAWLIGSFIVGCLVMGTALKARSLFVSDRRTILRRKLERLLERVS